MMCCGDTDFCPHGGCTTCQGPSFHRPDPDNGAGQTMPSAEALAAEALRRHRDGDGR